MNFAERAKELVSKMTLEERMAQLCNKAPAIERLGVPSYDWWNEGDPDLTVFGHCFHDGGQMPVP